MILTKQHRAHVALYHRVMNWSHAVYAFERYWSFEEYNKMWDDAFAYMIEEEKKPKPWECGSCTRKFSSLEQLGEHYPDLCSVAKGKWFWREGK